jgi:hypothetical protein
MERCLRQGTIADPPAFSAGGPCERIAPPASAVNALAKIDGPTPKALGVGRFLYYWFPSVVSGVTERPTNEAVYATTAFSCGGSNKIAPWTRAKRVPRRVP